MNTCVTMNAPEPFAVSRARAGRGEQEIIAESGKFREVVSQAEMVAATDCTVIIQGDTGTGKEVIPGVIHNHSPRRQHVVMKNKLRRHSTRLAGERTLRS
jgi:transcriptional regulator with GAF, ATPase, and Fis domain